MVHSPNFVCLFVFNLNSYDFLCIFFTYLSFDNVWLVIFYHFKKYSSLSIEYRIGSKLLSSIDI